MSKNNSSVLLVIVLFVLVGILGVGFINLNSVGGASLESGGIMEEMDYSTLNTKSDDWETFIPYIYSNPQIEVNNASNQVTVTVTLWFGSNGYAITSWDTLVREDNNFYVNIETWLWNGYALCVIMAESYTYDLGCLEEGEYSFTFQSWNETVRIINFSVINSSAQESIPDLFPPEQVNISENGNGDVFLSWENDVRNELSSITGYKIYRVNTTAGVSELLIRINSPEITSCMDYGVPNGDWRYFVTVLDNWGMESDLSEPGDVFIDDVIGPGSPTNLNARVEGGNVTLSWNAPDLLNRGSDIIGYEILVVSRPSDNYWDIFSNVTLYKRFETSYSFNNIPSGLYEVLVWAFDDNGNDGYHANISLDLREASLPVLISPHPNVIAAYTSLEIRIRLNGAEGIQEVLLNYTVDREIPQIVRMNIAQCFSNGTLILTGQIPGQSAGVRVDFCITAVDLYGDSTTSLSFSYQVSTNEFAHIEGVSWWMVTIICIVIGAVTVSAYGSIKFFVNLTKEKKIKALLEKVVNAPSSSNFENIEVLTSHSEDPRVIIENPFEPVNFNLEYYQYQRFAGRIDGFEFVCLLGIFNSLLKAFPALNQYFEGINKLIYITEIKNLSLREQLELFKYLINRNSDFDIQLEIDNLMLQLNTSEEKHKWEYLLPQLNYCYDLSQVLSDREYSNDFFLLGIIIMRW